MVRKLILALVILAVAAVPAQALERQFFSGHQRFEHERFDRQWRHHRHVYSPYRHAYAPRCSWQPAYWVTQIYPSGNGAYAYVPQFVPGQWICG